MEKSKYIKGDMVKYLTYLAKIEGVHQDVSTGKFKYHIRYRKWFSDNKHVYIKANFINESDLIGGKK